MFTCHVCGSAEAHDQTVSEVFTIDGRRVLVEKIPAQVCRRCGEATFARETTEQIRRLVHESAAPVRTESMEVYALA